MSTVFTPNPVKEEGERRVTFIKDSLLAYPEMWLDVFVAGSPTEERQFAQMFVRSRCRKAEIPELSDVIVFAGGPDVDPLLYGQTRHKTTCIDVPRDKADMELYKFGLMHGIPMIGICRGAQFLAVMNGGSLYQDVDRHHGDHDMWDIHNKKLIKGISSVHHQMVMDDTANGMHVIAFTSGRSQFRAINATQHESGSNKDIEAFFYRDSCCLGFQGHPEYEGYPEYTKWSLEIINQFFMENPDLEYRDKKLRIKRAVMEEREARIRKEIN